MQLHKQSPSDHKDSQVGGRTRGERRSFQPKHPRCVTCSRTFSCSQRKPRCERTDEAVAIHFIIHSVEGLQNRCPKSQYKPKTAKEDGSAQNVALQLPKVRFKPLPKKLLDDVSQSEAISGKRCSHKIRKGTFESFMQAACHV